MAPTPSRSTGGLTADRASDRHAMDEHPSDVRDRLTPDQATFVEQPLVVAVEFLERVVRQHGRVGLVCDAEHERIPSPDGAGGRGDQLVVRDTRLEFGDLLLVDPVTEGGVDDDGDRRIGMLLDEAHHRIVELRQARQ